MVAAAVEAVSVANLLSSRVSEGEVVVAAVVIRASHLRRLTTFSRLSSAVATRSRTFLMMILLAA